MWMKEGNTPWKTLLGWMFVSLLCMGCGAPGNLSPETKTQTQQDDIQKQTDKENIELAKPSPSLTTLRNARKSQPALQPKHPPQGSLAKPQPTWSPPTTMKSWLYTQGGSSFVQATHVETDAQGNTYVLGHFRHQVAMGSLTLVARREWGIYVAKYNDAGSLAWAQQVSLQPQSTSTDRIVTEAGLALDSQGHITIALNTKPGELQFGLGALRATGSSPWLARLDAQGRFLWSKPLTKIKSVGFLQVVAATGAIYVRGQVSQRTSFGNTTLTGDSRFSNVFVGALSSDGTPQWAIQGGALYSNNANLFTFHVDSQGNLWLVGSEGVVSLTFRGNKSIRSTNLSYPFVAMAKDGYLSWYKEGTYGMSLYQYRIKDGNIDILGTVNRTTKLGGTPIVTKKGSFHIRLDNKGTFLQNRDAPHYVRYYIKDSFFRGDSYVFLGHSTYPITIGETRVEVSKENPYFLAEWNIKTDKVKVQRFYPQGQPVALRSGPSDRYITVEHVKGKAAVQDLMVAQVDPETTWYKAQTRSTGLATLKPLQMATLSDGSHAILAEAQGRLPFRWLNVDTNGQSQFILLRLNTEGKVLWAKEFPTDRFHVDKDDNICAYGLTQQPIQVTKDIKIPGWSLFVVKWDAGGRFHHLQTTEFSASVPSQQSVMDKEGNLYVAGIAFRSLTIGGVSAKQEHLYRVYVAKISPRGKVLWLAGGGGQQYDSVGTLAVDHKGYVYLGGVEVGDNIKFGDLKVPQGDKTYGRAKGMVVLDPQGNFHSITAEAHWNCESIRLTPSVEGVLVTGSCPYGIAPDKQPTTVIAKYNKEATILWNNTLQGKITLQIASATPDIHGNIVLYGTFEEKLQLGQHTLQSKGHKDIVLAWVNPKGEWWKATSFGGPKDEMLSSLSIYGDNITLLGSTRGMFQWNSLTFPQQGGNPLFVLGTHLSKLLP
ncbi:MAG: hypothetical protein EP343_18110 [Deltaproteobacteria bacterium]|nr:MAG: hypothetical protein EP343_18110 [Deltaproteobacteria bacterium]